MLIAVTAITSVARAQSNDPTGWRTTTNAGYGVFVGGQNLESEQRKFIAFLLHRDGRVSVERHDGKQMTTVVAPTQDFTQRLAPARR